MTQADDRATETVREQYRRAFGSVPGGDRTPNRTRASDRVTAVEAIEKLRATLIRDNPLQARVQQLVHSGQLAALDRPDAARLHAAAALRASARLPDLMEVAEIKR